MDNENGEQNLALYSGIKQNISRLPANKMSQKVVTRKCGNKYSFSALKILCNKETFNY